MKMLVFIIFIGIASVVFYLFLRNLFGERSCNVTNLQPKTKTQKGQKQTKDSEGTISQEEAQPVATEEASEVIEYQLKETTVSNQDLE